jgi:hypothetical protein
MVADCGLVLVWAGDMAGYSTGEDVSAGSKCAHRSLQMRPLESQRAGLLASSPILRTPCGVHAFSVIRTDKRERA